MFSSFCLHATGPADTVKLLLYWTTCPWRFSFIQAITEAEGNWTSFDSLRSFVIQEASLVGWTQGEVFETQNKSSCFQLQHSSNTWAAVGTDAGNRKKKTSSLQWIMFFTMIHVLLLWGLLWWHLSSMPTSALRQVRLGYSLPGAFQHITPWMLFSSEKKVHSCTVGLMSHSRSPIYLFSISLICASSSQAPASSHLISKRAEMHCAGFTGTPYIICHGVLFGSLNVFILFSLTYTRVHLDLCCSPACRCSAVVPDYKPVQAVNHAHFVYAIKAAG